MNAVFGPVPSRRLGNSLGINTIPVKTCTYSCVYCQVGKTLNMTIDRQPFYQPTDVFHMVQKKFAGLTSRDGKIDYLTFVSDGDPTLDRNLGKEIALLKQIGVPIAVLTNASLLWRDDVQEDLLAADLVSLKVDAVSKELWRKINRPHQTLKLDPILNGILEFSKKFTGTLLTETMLVNGLVNSNDVEEVVTFLNGLGKLDKSYVAVPTRPPTEQWVKPAEEETVNATFQVFAKKLGASRVEFLIGYEGNAFAFTGNVVEDLLSITAVHPMHKEAINICLKKVDANWTIVEQLLSEHKLVELNYEGNVFYMRKLPTSIYE